MFECFVLHKSLNDRDGIYYSLGCEDTEELAKEFCWRATREYDRPVIFRPYGYDPEWWSK